MFCATTRCREEDLADNRGVAEGEDGLHNGTTGLTGGSIMAERGSGVPSRKGCSGGGRIYGKTSFKKPSGLSVKLRRAQNTHNMTFRPEKP